jgi:hypothetical protein
LNTGDLSHSDEVALTSRAAAVLGCKAEQLLLRTLYRGPLLDSLHVLSIFRRYGSNRPAEILLMYSPEIAPDAARNAAARAGEAASALGPDLACRVLTPVEVGVVGERSYAVVPRLQALAARRPLQWLQFRCLRPTLFDWLFSVAATTSCRTEQGALLTNYARPLEALAETSGASPVVRRAAEDACVRLRANAWLPQQCLMHGDLWHGNLMLKNHRGITPKWAGRLTIIDWGGSRVDGYPFFDLLVVAQTLRSSPALVRNEILRHAQLLKCAPTDSTAYALAAVGSLLLNPGYVPTETLCQLAAGIHEFTRKAQLPMRGQDASR